MKKFLLFAVAAVIAVSASAQNVGTKAVASKSNALLQPNNAVNMQIAPQVQYSPNRYTIAKEASVRKSVKNLQTAKDYTPVAKKFTPAKAPALAEAYTGMGSSSVSGAQTWTVTAGTIEFSDGTTAPGLINLLSPSYWAENGIDEIYVTYEEKANGTLYIPAQQILTGSEYDVYLVNYSAASSDGSITLTIDNEGNLTADTPYMAYVAVEKDATEFLFGDEWLGTFESYSNVKYAIAGEASAPTPICDTDDLLLFTSLSKNGYSFNYPHVLLPAYSPVTFINYTMEPADAYSWSVYNQVYDELAGTYVKDQLQASGTDKTFTFVTNPQYLYASPEFTASFQGHDSDPLAFMGEDAIVYGGGTTDNWEFEDGDRPILSRANIESGIQGIVNASADATIKSLISYQGKPAAPLFFTGVNLLVYNFSATDDFTLTCKIRKASRATGSLVLGDVIAESKVDRSDLEKGNWYNTVDLKFNKFVVKDEYGFEKTLDYIFVDDEFVIQIDGWNNGTFEGLSIGSSGFGGGKSSTYVIRTADEDYSGYGYTSYYGNLFVGFLGATYGYLHTEENTNLSFGKEGGEAVLTIEPMLVSVNDDDEFETSVWIENEEEYPEWADIDIVNENYQTDEDGYLTVCEFGLKVIVEALPEGETSRTGEIILAQEGAQLKITLTQTATDGIAATAVATTKADTNKVYNLAGQRVNNNYKGIIVRNGQKMIQK